MGGCRQDGCPVSGSRVGKWGCRGALDRRVIHTREAEPGSVVGHEPGLLPAVLLRRHRGRRSRQSGQGECEQVRRMGSVSEELSLVPLHQRPELLEACAELLREEWGKSRASRLHTLQRSSDAFPICLLLLRSRGPTEIPGPREGPCQLVGHVRLSRVVGRPRDLYVESVVVARALRGQGYGRRLMEATERWARARGFGCLHLTTHDKQHFYAHLGYVLGEPVQSVAFLSPAISSEVLRLFSAPPGAAITIRPRVPSAPPPPLPPLTVPPPPPPPTVIWARGVLAENSKQSLLKTPHRDAKGLPIFWMKKDI
ncbi:PREDICTED: N-acetyltransferase 6 isoform X1 [Lepidothrix coronata]|uniref:N-alpha-acetyltransferase 80 n=1 Tax=Lepidothrix coronata TaxID=321398 RepID=A0A6J0HPI8_9PASS|nr:PREDICTED: N-acetyltransferase 6 isoform X1 [Lepidothrix coronata]